LCKDALLLLEIIINFLRNSVAIWWVYDVNLYRIIEIFGVGEYTTLEVLIYEVR